MRASLRLLLALLLPAALSLAACGPEKAAPPPPPPDKLTFSAANFADLPGWNEDRQSEALPALQRSCAAMLRGGDERAAGFGTIAEWREPCQALAGLPAADDAALRRLLESQFQPLLAANNGKPLGLFTGYYESSLRGSRRPTPKNPVPLYGRPADLITVDLGQFRDSLRGQRIAGRVDGGALKPYETRAEIDAGALRHRAPVLLWVSDPVEAFFLHIQGSGRVELDEGGVVRVGFAAQNGHPYIAVGRKLIERGALSREQVSMQSIRGWMSANPSEASALMGENPSFVFFREIVGDGPLGAQNVALTPGRSLAVDRKYFSLGVPMWLEVARPDADPTKPDQPLRRLMVAQDTGGAITGPVRGDVFWGHGAEAAAIAGRMKHEGRYWLLLPKSVASRLLAGV